MFHRDFSPEKLKHHHAAQLEGLQKCTYPWTLLVTLSGPGYLYVCTYNGQVIKVLIPHGCGVLFRGDVLHAGAAYQLPNTRAHWYLTPVHATNHTPSPKNWRVNVDGEVALFDEDPFNEWNADSSLQEPLSSVELATPFIRSVSELADCPLLLF